MCLPAILGFIYLTILKPLPATLITAISSSCPCSAGHSLGLIGAGGVGVGGGIKRDPDRQGEALHVRKADFSQTSCSSQVFIYDAR